MICTLDFVQIHVDMIQDFLQMDLGRVEEHHHCTRRADLIWKAQCKTTLEQGNLAFQTRDSTSREIKFGQNVTK